MQTTSPLKFPRKNVKLSLSECSIFIKNLNPVNFHAHQDLEYFHCLFIQSHSKNVEAHSFLF